MYLIDFLDKLSYEVYFVFESNPVLIGYVCGFIIIALCLRVFRMLFDDSGFVYKDSEDSMRYEKNACSVCELNIRGYCTEERQKKFNYHCDGFLQCDESEV